MEAQWLIGTLHQGQQLLLPLQCRQLSVQINKVAPFLRDSECFLVIFVFVKEGKLRLTPVQMAATSCLPIRPSGHFGGHQVSAVQSHCKSRPGSDY